MIMMSDTGHIIHTTVIEGDAVRITRDKHGSYTHLVGREAIISRDLSNGFFIIVCDEVEYVFHEDELQRLV